MPKFEVWVEGYRATGDSGTAMYWGTFEAENFDDACTQAVNNGEHDAYYFDAARLMYWGCRMFDNETDARKAFG